MKAKIIISPAAKWIIHHDIDREVRKDAAFIESAAVNSVVYVLRLGGYKPVSKKNIAVFCGEFYQKANRFLQIDPYKWPEYMKEQCEMRKLSYDDEWEKLRDREGDQPAGNWHILPKKGAVESYYQQKKDLEEGYLTGCMLSIAAFTAMDALGYSAKKAQNLFNKAMNVIEDFADEDITTWPDMIANWLKTENIPFDGYWVKPAEGYPLPDMDQEQLDNLHASRSMIVSDAELRERTKYRSIKR